MASSTTPLSALSFATWNVRGFTSKSKGSSLAADCKRYNIDLVFLPVTKTTERDEMLLQGPGLCSDPHGTESRKTLWHGLRCLSASQWQCESNLSCERLRVLDRSSEL